MSSYFEGDLLSSMILSQYDDNFAQNLLLDYNRNEDDVNINDYMGESFYDTVQCKFDTSINMVNRFNIENLEHSQDSNNKKLTNNPNALSDIINNNFVQTPDFNSTDCDCENLLISDNKCVNEKSYNRSQNTTLNTEVLLDGIISTSVNILNGDVPLSQDVTKELTQINQEPHTILSRAISIASVASLKTYKDLDMKSCDNFLIHTNDFINHINSSTHKIPVNEDYIHMFKTNEPVRVKSFVPMSTQYGDIGLNKFYSDYVKESGHTADCNDNSIITKIIQMYPTDNRIFVCINIK
nr:uncharacterized protein LOC116776210 isoform X2 [Danaus plexippus plexippus]